MFELMAFLLQVSVVYPDIVTGNGQSQSSSAAKHWMPGTGKKTLVKQNRKSETSSARRGLMAHTDTWIN